jgi:uncharacterized cupredoxin-like copper-binding protein
MKSNSVYKTILLSITIASLSIGCAALQSDDSPHANPYSGQQVRSIKAMSEKDQKDLLEGKGLGYAKAAELNGYPGPMHTLEHADAMELSKEQRTQTQSLLISHKTAVRALGKQLVEAERQLDLAFASRQMTPEKLNSLAGEIGRLQEQELISSKPRFYLHFRFRNMQTYVATHDNPFERHEMNKIRNVLALIMALVSPATFAAGAHEGGHSGDNAIGVPGTASEIARTIRIDMKDFPVHEALMKNNPEMEHADENQVTVAPGKSGDIIWKFTKAGKVSFACLQPGHFDAGMKGVVKVAGPTKQIGHLHAHKY